MTDDTTAEFWFAFQKEAASLANQMARGDLRAAFDRVEGLLERYGFDFSFDMTETEANEPVLILTPEGDPAAARRIDEVMARRPEIRGWRFYGRRQRKPLDDAFVFVRRVHGLDVGDATYDVRESAAGHEVTMYSAAFQSLTSEEAWAAAATFLDHSIGEDVVMSRVSKIVTEARGRGTLSAVQLVRLLVGN